MSNTDTRFPFTHRSLSKLPPCPAASASTGTEYSDTEVVGLKLQVSKAGRKVFYFRYTINRQKRAAKIGEFPAIDVTEARKAALEMRAQIDRGLDPQADRDALAEMPTFRQFGEDSYMPDARTRKASHKDDACRLRVHVYPALGEKKMSEVTTRDVQQLLARVADKTSKSTANRVHSLVARMFKLAQVWGVIERSPCYGLSKFKEPKKAERFLTPEEITRFQAALAADKNTLAASALRLLLLTGLRRNEVIRAKWEQVDLAAGLLHLPKTKTGARYAVLNSAAKELLASLPNRGQGTWIFPGTKPGQPMAQPTRVLVRALKRAGIDRLRVHDLRHTFAATCVNSGASLYEVQKLLGHSSPTMTQRYAHLASDTIRRASEAMAVVAGGGSPAPAPAGRAA
ncbi:MAG TPA: tyrosine-type recombinase/integrase [Burkholderiaceae bacterium]|nr:tyrosine-type recombinase/integrase [Burkholderiaceae bacterium]